MFCCIPGIYSVRDISICRTFQNIRQLSSGASSTPYRALRAAIHHGNQTDLALIHSIPEVKSLFGYYSPVGTTYHAIVYTIIIDLHVAIDVNFSRRTNGMVSGQLLVAKSKNMLAYLVGNRYLALTVWSAPVGTSNIDLYDESRNHLYDRFFYKRR